MRLIMIAAAATIALAAPVLAQTQSEPTNTVGSGTAKALDPGPPGMVGKPVSPSNMRRSSSAGSPNQAGAASKNGADKADGTTGAPAYSGSKPKPSSSTGADPSGG